MFRPRLQLTLGDLCGFTALIAVLVATLRWRNWDTEDRILLIAWGAGTILGLALGRSHKQLGLLGAAIGGPLVVIAGMAGVLLFLRIPAAATSRPWAWGWTDVVEHLGPITVLLALALLAGWLVALAYVLTADLAARILRQRTTEPRTLRRLRWLWCAAGVLGILVGGFWAHDRSLRLRQIKSYQVPELLRAGFSPDGKRMAVGTDRSIEIWNVEDGSRMTSLQRDAQWPYLRDAVFLLSDGHSVIEHQTAMGYLGIGARTACFDLRLGSKVWEHERERGVAFSRSGSFIAESTALFPTDAFEIRDSRTRKTLYAVEDRAPWMEPWPDGVSEDGDVVVARVSHAFAVVKRGQPGIVRRLILGAETFSAPGKMSGDGNWFYCVTQLWDTRTGERRELDGIGCDFAGNDRYLIVHHETSLARLVGRRLPVLRTMLADAWQCEVLEIPSLRVRGYFPARARKALKTRIHGTDSYVAVIEGSKVTLWELPKVPQNDGS